MSSSIRPYHEKSGMIIIAPSTRDSEAIKVNLDGGDNFERTEHALEFGIDVGRSEEMDWFEVRIGFTAV